VSAIAGIVLAGGGSTRFGSDKLLVPYRGTPLLHRAIERAAEVSDDVIVVMSPTAADPTVPEGARVVRDESEGEGPLAGLHAGLLAAVRSDLAVVVAGDMPDLQASVLRALVEALQGGGDAAALATSDGPSPLPIVLRTWPAADAVHTLLHAGRRRLGDVLDVLDTVVIDEATWAAMDPGRRSLFDVDRPEDLER
jgi:molybdopterin-guanine dinucleotide biosynthesis protein A